MGLSVGWVHEATNTFIMQTWYLFTPRQRLVELTSTAAKPTRCSPPSQHDKEKVCWYVYGGGGESCRFTHSRPSHQSFFNFTVCPNPPIWNSCLQAWLEWTVSSDVVVNEPFTSSNFCVEDLDHLSAKFGSEIEEVKSPAVTGNQTQETWWYYWSLALTVRFSGITKISTSGTSGDGGWEGRGRWWQSATVERSVDEEEGRGREVPGIQAKVVQGRILAFLCWSTL